MRRIQNQHDHHHSQPSRVALSPPRPSQGSLDSSVESHFGDFVFIPPTGISHGKAQVKFFQRYRWGIEGILVEFEVPDLH